MATQFGFLSKLNFLQNWLSYFISNINPAIIHNIEKYYAIKKVFYLSSIENLDGDYLEFGVYTGSSFCHSMRCCTNARKLNLNIENTKFFGFDSFEGFGELANDEKHSFYTDTNFATNYNRVLRRAQKASKGLKFNLVKGYFSETLKNGPLNFGIQKARIIFIDSDTYSSALDAMNFSQTIIQEGTFIILDDYFSYKGSLNKGVAAAFKEFKESLKFETRDVLTYGMGGKVFVISKLGRL